jgi:predicted ATP-grasp superfamily ATP-dependent carboligase
MERGIIVFSGFNQRGVIAFLRTVFSLNKKSKDKKIKVGIVALPKGDTIFKTSYKDLVVAAREKMELDLDDIKRVLKEAKVKMRINRCMIAPSTEALNRYLLKHRNDLQNLGCELPLVEKDLYEKISDKLSFSFLCENNEIEVPPLVTPSCSSIPFVAKPKSYFSKKGKVFYPVLIKNKGDFRRFKRNYNFDDFFYQKYINGVSFYLLYYFYKNGKIAKFSQENLIQQAGGKSIVAAIPSRFHFEAISEKFENLFLSVKFFGLVMIEIRREGGVDYMIEANPRFWGPSQLFVDAKPNLFESFLYDTGFLDMDVIDFKTDYQAKYFWNGGIIKSKGDIAFHNYTCKKFLREFSKWMSHEIYLREDTKRIFYDETKV